MHDQQETILEQALAMREHGLNDQQIFAKFAANAEQLRADFALADRLAAAGDKISAPKAVLEAALQKSGTSERTGFSGFIYTYRVWVPAALALIIVIGVGFGLGRGLKNDNSTRGLSNPLAIAPVIAPTAQPQPFGDHTAIPDNSLQPAPSGPGGKVISDLQQQASAEQAAQQNDNETQSLADDGSDLNQLSNNNYGQD